MPLNKYQKLLIIILVIIPIAGTLWLYYSPAALPFLHWVAIHGGNYYDLLSGYISVIALGISIIALINALRS